MQTMSYLAASIRWINDGTALLLQLCLEFRDKIARTLAIEPAEELDQQTQCFQ
jgi:hypothetical protein